jgi:glutamate/tyrosine decarboxylase-like PLP-dependent enzyme
VQTILSDAAARAIRYLDAVKLRHVGATKEALSRLTVFDGPLPTHGEDPNSILKTLDEVGAPATIASTGGRFFGGVVGGALPITVAAHWMADAWDQNACLFDFSPVSAHLEDVVLGWILTVLDLPTNSGGAFVTGTQMADVTALAAARTAVLSRVGWNVEKDGLFEAPPISVIVSEEVHATMLKALALLGLGNGRVRIVPTDSQGRMRSTEIPPLKGPAIICTQVGNVNTGSCDPVGEICAAAAATAAWVHVDGAFGLWAAASPKFKHLVEGVKAADSWAIDAHKWLNVPQDSGIAIVRDSSALKRAMSVSASYYPEPSLKREPMQWSPESSRRPRAIEIWAALRSLGKTGVADLIERTCRFAQTFAHGFRAAGYEILNDVVLNQLLVSFGDDDATTRIIEVIQAEGTCWCGGTVWKGRKAMRLSVCSWATTEADVAQSLEAILRIAANDRHQTNANRE